MASWTEWSFYPNFGQPKTYHTGKRCFIDNMNHPRSMRCISDNSLESSIGRKKKGKGCNFTSVHVYYNVCVGDVVHFNCIGL